MGFEIPRHIAIIMDGNSRWAKQNGKSLREGHLAGFNNIMPVAELIYAAGVKCLTLFAFSTENWNRSKEEVEFIVNFAKLFDERELQKYHERGVRMLHIGHTERLARETQALIERAIKLTERNTKMDLCVAFDYGGRDEIINAVRGVVRAGLTAEQVDEAVFSKYMMTADLPDPDLVIRTSGENRISNFLIWQASYAEFYVSPTYWPDFGKADVDAVLAEYAKRQRRFGGR